MAYGLTQSADLEAGSNNGFSRADDSLLDESLPFTIEMWVNLESAPSSDSIVLMSKSGGGATGYVFRYQDIAGTKSLNLVKAAVIDQNVNITALSLSTWYHIAAVQTSTQVEYFVNGSSVGTFSNASAYISSVAASVFIGRVDTGVGGSNTDGKISLVRFWQADKSADINTNKCRVLGSTTGLSAEWTLNNTLDDNSGNGFTLTNINSTPFVSDVPSVCGGGSTPSSNLLCMGVG